MHPVISKDKSYKANNPYGQTFEYLQSTHLMNLTDMSCYVFAFIMGAISTEQDLGILWPPAF
jgi:hypothetical protein